MPIQAAVPFLFTQKLFFNSYVNRIVGPTNLTFSRDRYIEAARDAGLTLALEDDVTANTLPTYAVVRRVARRIGQHVVTAHLGTAGMQLVGRLGLLRYLILALEKPTR